MKKLLSILLALTLVFSFCTVANADENIKVIIDITTVKFDVPPTIVNGRTLVPLRAIFEALGATVDWDDATQTVTSEKGETKISLTINSNIMTVNGEEKTLDVPATLIDSRTLVPVRAISESFGLQVGWDGENNIVSILSNTEVFTMLYAKGSRSKVFAKSSATTQAKHGWHEYPVTAVYSADGKETIVASDEFQSYLDSGYYAYPVKTVFAADGSETVIRAEEFDAYIANGYLTEKPVVPVENDGNTSVHFGKDVKELTVKTVSDFMLTTRSPKTVKIHSVYAGFYKSDFLVVLNATAINASKNKPEKCEVVLRLNADNSVNCLCNNWWHQGLDRGYELSWAADLIPQKATLFENYGSKEIINEILAILAK